MQVHETITNVFAVIFSFFWPHVFIILSLYGAGSSLNVHLFGLEQGTKCILYARIVLRMQRVWVGEHFLHLIYCGSYRDHEMPRRNLLAWHFIDNRHLMSLLAFPIPSFQLHPRYSHE